ncbi:MAG: LacI family DNA-binding transcriptional regulator [Tropicimonas sp.]|uniref:LacI family DNA-binding transcriptional regulator n=1 Tax=Tropicimonas sp. TaxID=2067044 RepID=UPI003A890B8E
MERINAEKVAELAGVSRSAVSRSFSGNGRVSEETRRKVFEASKQLGYRPNALASNLARRTSDIVAIINSDDHDLRETFFTQSLSRAIFECGMTPLMLSVRNDDTGAETLARFLRFPLFTAIVCADSVEAKNVVPYCSCAPPIMLNENFTARETVDAVQIDEQKGISELIGHLGTLGHRAIWFISGRHTTSAYSSRRIALLEALARSDLRLIDSADGDFSYQSGECAFETLLARGPLPDAVFCANDLMAMGAMDRARFNHKLTVPDDLYFAGFDDIPQASWPSYRLPSIRQSDAEIIESIIGILRYRTKHSDGNAMVSRIPTQFIPRTLEVPAAGAG